MTKKRRLLHELVHAADTGGLAAYSSEWVRFARPRMKKVRLIYQILRPSDRRLYSIKLQDERFWPSLYGAQNLVEGLAEAISYEQYGSFKFDLDIRQLKCLKSVFDQPEERQLKWRKLVKEGILAAWHGESQEAIRRFSQAQQLISNAPVLHYLLAESYKNIGNNSAALAEINICRKQFRTDLPP